MPSRLVGEYRLIQLVGEGSFGKVSMWGFGGLEAPRSIGLLSCILNFNGCTFRFRCK